MESEVSGNLSQPQPGQAGQYLVADIRQLVDIIDQRERDPAHPGAAEIRKLVGDFVLCADKRIAADRLGEVALRRAQLF